MCRRTRMTKTNDTNELLIHAVTFAPTGRNQINETSFSSLLPMSNRSREKTRQMCSDIFHFIFRSLNRDQVYRRRTDLCVDQTQMFQKIFQQFDFRFHFFDVRRSQGRIFGQITSHFIYNRHGIVLLSIDDVLCVFQDNLLKFIRL